MANTAKARYKSSDPIVYNPGGYDVSGFLASYKYDGKGKTKEQKYKLKPLPKKPNKIAIVLGKLTILFVLYIYLVFITGIAIPTFSVDGVLFDVPSYVMEYIEGPFNSVVALLTENNITYTIFIKPMDFIIGEYSTFLTSYADNMIMQYVVAAIAIIGLFLTGYIDIKLFYDRSGLLNNFVQLLVKVLFIFNLIALVCTVSYYNLLVDAGLF